MKTLDNTVFSPVYNLAWSNGDKDLFDKISIVMLLFVVASTILNIIKPVSYGKTAVTLKGNSYYIWNYPLSSKFVWRYGFIATIVVPVIMIILTPCAKIWNFCNFTGLAIHSIHYFNRTINYPSKISSKATPQTLWFFLLMVLVTTFHGFIQSHHLLNVLKTEVSYVTCIGICFSVTGAFINSYHDSLLINLRNISTSTKNKSNYQIPRGGLFEYISCANYFGELLEWWGYFMVTRGHPQMLFAVFATSFLGLRARFAHTFYKKKFGNSYPANRRAIIPFIY